MYGMGDGESAYWDNRLWVKKRNLIGDKRWGKRSMHKVEEYDRLVNISKSVLKLYFQKEPVLLDNIKKSTLGEGCCGEISGHDAV